MDDLYEKAWHRAIGDLNSHKANMAREVIMRTFLAIRPLTVEALGEILMASGFGSGIDPVSEQEIVSACAGLIRTEGLEKKPRWPDREVEGATAEVLNRVVVLSHPSVHRYFRTKQESLFPCAEDALANTCLKGLNATDILGKAYFYLYVLEWYESCFPQVLT